MEDKGPKTSQRLGPASSNPDYTGFAHLLTSGNQSDDDENISVRDNVSLSEQMTDLWLSKANEIQKDSRPNKKPPKPPGKLPKNHLVRSDVSHSTEICISMVLQSALLSIFKLFLSASNRY